MILGTEPSHGLPGGYQSEGKGAAAVFAGWAPNGWAGDCSVPRVPGLHFLNDLGVSKSHGEPMGIRIRQEHMRIQPEAANREWVRYSIWLYYIWWYNMIYIYIRTYAGLIRMDNNWTPWQRHIGCPARLCPNMVYNILLLYIYIYTLGEHIKRVFLQWIPKVGYWMFIPLTFRQAAEVEKAEARVGMGRDG